LFLLNRPLWLASSSRYRRELLGRLGHPFEWRAPDIDETRLPGESPKALASRLALAKAKTLALDEPRALIVGSDQVCALDEDCLGKPASPAAQAEMLTRLSGRRVTFFTAVAVVGIEAGLWQQHVDETHCEFRPLSPAEIAAYVAAEPVTDCAGGFKCEGLGISLLERMLSDDPTAIIGLPLIWLARSLRPFSAPDSSSATA
jgi:septum formation protein